MFLLNSRIPLVRFSSELAASCIEIDPKRSNPRQSDRPRVAPQPARQLRSSRKGLYAQPSEPILFPKLRIYFADFPYLHYSIDQRLLTLETRCGYWYDRVCKSTSYSDFQGSSRTHLTSHRVRCSSCHISLSSG